MRSKTRPTSPASNSLTPTTSMLTLTLVLAFVAVADVHARVSFSGDASADFADASLDENGKPKNDIRNNR